MDGRFQEDRAVYMRWEKREEGESPFYYKKFGNIVEYYGEVMRIAS